MLVDIAQEEHKARYNTPPQQTQPQRIGDLLVMPRFVKVAVEGAQSKGAGLLEASSLKDREDPVTRRTREASIARATKKREIVSKKREATTTRHRELELEQPPTYHPDVG